MFSWSSYVSYTNISSFITCSMAHCRRRLVAVLSLSLAYDLVSLSLSLPWTLSLSLSVSFCLCLSLPVCPPSVTFYRSTCHSRCFPLCLCFCLSVRHVNHCPSTAWQQRKRASLPSCLEVQQDSHSYSTCSLRSANDNNRGQPILPILRGQFLA